MSKPNKRIELGTNREVEFACIIPECNRKFTDTLGNRKEREDLFQRISCSPHRSTVRTLIENVIIWALDERLEKDWVQEEIDRECKLLGLEKQQVYDKAVELAEEGRFP